MYLIQWCLLVSTEMSPIKSVKSKLIVCWIGYEDNVMNEQHAYECGMNEFNFCCLFVLFTGYVVLYLIELYKIIYGRLMFFFCLWNVPIGSVYIYEKLWKMLTIPRITLMYTRASIRKQLLLHKYYAFQWNLDQPSIIHFISIKVCNWSES